MNIPRQMTQECELSPCHEEEPCQYKEDAYND